MITVAHNRDRNVTTDYSDITAPDV